MRECLASLIEALGLHRGFKETAEVLELSGVPSEDTLEETKHSIRCIKKVPYLDVELLDGEYEPIEVDDLNCQEISIRVHKPCGETLYFATSQGLWAALSNTNLQNTRQIFLLGDFEQIKTKRFLIQPWSEEQSRVEAFPREDSRYDDVDPRWSLVRDLTGETLPSSLLQWIVLEPPTSTSTVWEQWKVLAVKKLASVLVSEIWTEGTSTKVSLAGSQRKVFHFMVPNEIEDTSYISLAKSVEWLLVKQDCEARHEALIRRLSDLIPRQTDAHYAWPSIALDAIPEALSGARLDHRAYVRSKSAESVKAMAELRKTVSEDVAKIIDRAQKLSGNLVTAIAALAGVLGLRLSILGTKGSSWISSILFCGVVLSVLWLALILLRKINDEALYNDLKHMRKWHSNIHTALTRKDYKRLALSPVLDAIRLYKKTGSRTIKLMTWASIIFVLLTLAPLLQASLEQVIQPQFVNDSGPAVDEKRESPGIGDSAQPVKVE